MISRISAFLCVAMLTATMAQAHSDGATHTHPHLVISNEFIAAALMTGALGLILTARHLLARRKK